MAAENKSQYKSFWFRLAIMLIFFMAVAGVVVFNLYKTMVVEKEFWSQFALKKDTVSCLPPRGNIFDCNGNLLVSSLPKYTVFIDFRCERLKKADSLMQYAEFRGELDTFALQLAQAFQTSKSAVKEDLVKELSKPYTRRMRNRTYAICGNGAIDHPTFTDLFASQFQKKYKCLGFDKKIKREHPFGTLSRRTIGEVFEDTENESKGGRCGLEQFYDGYLRGTSGLAVKQKIRGRSYPIPIVDPVEGYDLITTFDATMMDIVEAELKDVMIKGDAWQGCAVVMDVKTGEVKAMSNLAKDSLNRFFEKQNYAVSSMTEPGSVFKVASVIALLESGKVDSSYIIDTKDGRWSEPNWGRDTMRDSHVHGKISLAQSIWYSSNIGISKTVYDVYKSQPSKFVDKLYSMKLNEPLALEIKGSGVPNIPHPTDASANWSGLTLPWMSIGYSVQVPPIYTLTFYNGLANKGKMVKPMFVKAIVKDGHHVKTMGTEVLNPKLCNHTTLGKVHNMLCGVIEKEGGTGYKMGRSSIIPLAGKSGTARTYKNNKWDGASYQLSFCGYFPADNPQYSCIVVLWKKYMSSLPSYAFRRISERIYALGEKDIVADNNDERVKPYLPAVKNGRTKELKYIFDKLDLEYKAKGVNTELCVMDSKDSVEVFKPFDNKTAVVPNVLGWGAKDALFMLENRGLKVELSGRGKVIQQSQPAGTTVAKGSTIRITLKN